jgi:hypothetical protein
MREAILSNSGTAEFAIAERCWTKCYRVSTRSDAALENLQMAHFGRSVFLAAYARENSAKDAAKRL